MSKTDHKKVAVLGDTLQTKASSAGLHCVGHDHFETVLLNEGYDVSVDQMFDLVFTNSRVQRLLAERRRRKDTVWTPWTTETSGAKLREVTYTTLFRYKLRNKICHFIEKHLLYPESRSGNFYWVDVDCRSRDIPYGDCFSAVSRCYITRVSNNRCQLCVTIRSVSRKNVWIPVVKGLTSKTIIDGTCKSFQILAELLHKEEVAVASEEVAVASEEVAVASEEDSHSPKVVSSRRTSASQERSLHEDAQDASSSDDLHHEIELLDEDVQFQISNFISIRIIYFLFLVCFICLLIIITMLYNGMWPSSPKAGFQISVKGLKHSRLADEMNWFSSPDSVDLILELTKMVSSTKELIKAATETLEQLAKEETQS